MLERPRLTAAIRDGAARGIVVLTAPVGFGSTTAVAQAVHDGETAAWVSLDALDADPDHLARQVAQAVAAASGGRWEPDLDAPALELAAAALDAMEQFEIRTTVLDGVSAQVHAQALQVMQYLWANAPDSTGIIVTTHDNPSALPLPALSGRLSVLNEDDLALTPEEALQVVLQACPDLSSALVDDLVATAGGWTAACHEAALRAARRPDEDPVAWLRSEGAERVASAAIASTTADGASFLVATALLEELSAPLCDVVLGIGDSAERIAELSMYGCLVSPAANVEAAGLPVGQTWVRHPLLTAGLRRRAAGRDLSAMHRQAANWYQEAGWFTKAMNHLLASGDFAAAGEYLRQHEDALYESGDAEAAAGWYASLPAEVWDRRGWHLLRAAWGRAFTGQVRAAEVAVEHLLNHLAAAPTLDPDEESLHSEAALVSGYLAGMRGDPNGMVSKALRAIELSDSQTPTNSLQLAPILLAEGLLLRGDDQAARAHLDRIGHQPFPTDLLRESSLAGQRARCELMQGRVVDARLIARRAQEWLASQHLQEANVAQFNLLTTTLAVEIESGTPYAADGGFDAIIDSALAKGQVGDAVDALNWRARGKTAAGDLVGALACIAQARGLLFESSPGSAMAGQLDLQEAFIRYLGGDGLRAERLVQGLPRSDDRMLMWARITLARQGARALRMLAETEPTTPRREVEQQLLLAQAGLSRSTQLAENHLLRIADVASANGLGLAFLGSSQQLIKLAIGVGTRTGHDGLTALARAAARGFDSPPPGTDAHGLGRAASTPASLSPGEIELLAYLPLRETNSDIANHLGVSVNTVKTRLSRLYRKIGARSRNEAVALARQRGLLP